MIDRFNDLSINYENTGGWNKQNALLRARDNQPLIIADKCLARTPNINFRR
jgi:hypothetical protein